MSLNIPSAYQCIAKVCSPTPLEYNATLSEQYCCRIYLKREDRQVVRSYKIRGAYNKIATLSRTSLTKGVICASAGNHAQGVAYSCRQLAVNATIFMPVNTPRQKIERVKCQGGDWVEIILEGDSYDASFQAALHYNTTAGKTFIHAFDDEKVIEGQGTVGLEITEALSDIDYLFLPIGGGGLAAGVGSWFKHHSPSTILIGVEPAGAASMTMAFEKGYPVALDKIDPFVDGAAVAQVGSLTYPIVKQVISYLHQVAEGKVCSTLLDLYNKEAMVVEPAGCLSIAALDDFKDEIKGKKVVCIVSGGNNDVNRIEEIKKLAGAYEGLHHHLMIRFKHQPDDLVELFTVLHPAKNYVTRIEYQRREHGRSTFGLVSIKSTSQEDYTAFLNRLNSSSIEFNEVKKEDFLFKYLI